MMMQRSSIQLKIDSFIILFILSISISCSRSKYDRLVESEMEKSIIYDSTFFDLKLGDTKKEFFDKCWNLNKRKVVTHGSKKSFVQYILPTSDSSQSKIRMLFYGIFNDKKIMTGMNVEFSYEAWSLWNKSLQSKKLLTVVKDTLKHWFPGNDFIKIKSKSNSEELLIKIDGNRRILIKPITNTKDIKVRIDDLRFLAKK